MAGRRSRAGARAAGWWKEQRGSDTCGLNPWEGGGLWGGGRLRDDPGLLAKPPASTEHSVPRPSSHAYIRAFPLAPNPVCQGEEGARCQSLWHVAPGSVV